MILCPMQIEARDRGSFISVGAPALDAPQGVDGSEGVQSEVWLQADVRSDALALAGQAYLDGQGD